VVGDVNEEIPGSSISRALVEAFHENALDSLGKCSPALASGGRLEQVVSMRCFPSIELENQERNVGTNGR
jgi:hypothetical protein